MNNDLISKSTLLKILEESKKVSQQGLNKDAKFAYATHDYFINIVKNQPVIKTNHLV